MYDASDARGLEALMPFKSKAQAHFMFAAQARGDVKPGTAEEWAHATKSIKSLPEKLKGKAKSAINARPKKA
jgi:hypothetical protein